MEAGEEEDILRYDAARLNLAKWKVFSLAAMRFPNQFPTLCPEARSLSDVTIPFLNLLVDYLFRRKIQLIYFT